MSLGNFYTDLEKQPQLRKYSTMSEGCGGEDESNMHNDNGSQKTGQGTISNQTSAITKRESKSVSSNAIMRSPSQNAVDEILEKSSGP